MREHEINQLNNFIMGWYADDTSFCEQLIDLHNTSEHKGEGIVGPEYCVDYDRKQSVDSGFYASTLGWLKYGKFLEHCVEEYRKKYIFCELTGFSIKETFNVQYYPPGGGFKIWHSERNSSNEIQLSRHLVWMTYLNDLTDEGGTEFFYQGLRVAPKKGLTLIWPADWTFTHKGVVSETQEKYIVTGWLHLNKKVDNENRSLF